MASGDIKPLRILMLEDVPTDAELTERELRKGGLRFTHIRVDTEADFVENLESFQPDLILSDYALPSFDGISALEIVKKNHPHLPFIFVTGAMGEEWAIDTLKSGATDYVLKSRLSRLVPAVNRALHEVEERQERQRAETALKESEARLNTILQTVQVGIIVIDVETRSIVEVNNKAIDMIGETREEILGKECHQYICPTERGGCPVIDLGQQVDNSERELLHARGQSIPIIKTAVPIILKNRQCLLESFIDISERKEAEEELKKTKNYLKNVFDAIASMLIAVNSSRLVTQWNTGAERFTGIPAYKAVNRKLWSVVPFFKNYNQYFDQVARSQTHLELQREAIQVRDEKKYLNIAIYSLAQYGIEDLVIRVDDISGLVQKEEQLIQAQKMETVGNLAGGLAHDFNNVLGGIIGTLSLLDYKMKKPGEISPEKIKESLHVIHESAKRAEDMVSQLLALSRKQELTVQAVDLNQAVKRVLKICRNTFEKSIEIRTHYPKREAMVKADPTQIEQVLLNLCVNAAHAMTLMRAENQKRGGILDIAIERAPNGVQVQHRSSDDKTAFWLVKVADTGVGMTPQVQAKIFDPFFTTKNQSEGTGLGLTMVYNIIKQHDGFIRVSSDPGKGTCFSFFLPVLTRVDVSEKSGDKSEELPKGSGLILIVDDEEIVRRTARAILEECGYQTILAENGAEAVEIFKHQYQKIRGTVLDLAMPKLSGKEAYAKMKAIDPKLKVLLISGFKQDQTIKELLTLGVDGFLQKPFSMIDLAKKIAEILH